VKAADDPLAPPMVVALGLVDGDQQVSKPAPLVQGRVIEVIAEGTEVKKGDMLLKLDSGLYKATVDEATAALTDVKEKAEQAKDLPEQYRLKQVQQEKAIAAAEAERKATELDQEFRLKQAKEGITIDK